MLNRRRLLGMGGALGAGAVLAPALGALVGGSAAGAAVVGATGGSNYGWYRLDGCTREPYGVVDTFHTAAATIRTQLGQLSAAGQRRLRIPIYHRRGPSTGTVMDSTGGNLSAQRRQNLTDLLAAVKTAGFTEIQVAFMPIGDNFAAGWTTWNEDRYQENWNLIHNLRPILVASGIHYRIDLCNEAIPASSQPMLLKYAQRLWTDYTHVHGRDDTCGFSIIGMEADRIEHLPAVYGSTPPYLFDFHFYRTATTTEYQQFTAAHQLMNQMGYTSQGWTIGECYYNDGGAAAGLHKAIAETGRTVYYLLQWPLAAGSGCSDVSVAPPAAFDAYLGQGF